MEGLVSRSVETMSSDASKQMGVEEKGQQRRGTAAQSGGGRDLEHPPLLPRDELFGVPHPSQSESRLHPSTAAAK